ncbi:MAG: hypothetical protein Q8R82_21495 [Hyphomonadaceae bacterium]|nr:hypothetical protein [Hyphomonadaceae bacterium]
MSALAVTGRLEFYRERLSAFQEVEDFMGEVAELLTHVADALSGNPDEIDVSPGAPASIQNLNFDEGDWPSFARLQSLRQTWRDRRSNLLAAWDALSPREREAEPLPPFGSADPTRPLV